jgi:hypothetical protein
MPNLQQDEAHTRLQRVACLLKANNAKHSITYGLVEATPDEPLRELIARADTDLLHNRRHSRP